MSFHLIRFFPGLYILEPGKSDRKNGLKSLFGLAIYRIHLIAHAFFNNAVYITVIFADTWYLKTPVHPYWVMALPGWYPRKSSIEGY